jgi:hypothetical protein
MAWAVALLALSMGVIASTALSTAAQTAEWQDTRCDVGGYDWYQDETYSDRCDSVDIYWVEANNSRNAVTVTVKYGPSMPHRVYGELQKVWIQTRPDRSPEYLARVDPSGGWRSRVASWGGNGRWVRCPRVDMKVNVISRKLLLHIPRPCLGNPHAVRVSARTLDRYDDDRSFAQDFFPAPRRWSARLQRGNPEQPARPPSASSGHSQLVHPCGPA